MQRHCLNCYHLSLSPHQQGYSEMTPSSDMQFRCGAGKWDASGMEGGRAQIRGVFEASVSCEKFVPDEPSVFIDLSGNVANLVSVGRVVDEDDMTFDLGRAVADDSWGQYQDRLRKELISGALLSRSQMADLLSPPIYRPGKPELHKYRREGRTSVFKEVQ